MRLIDADALKEDIDNLRLFKKWIREEIKQHIDNAPTVAESCKELHKVATERPQTIDCTNCKYESKRLIDEPCKDCNIKYSEWEAKDETN